jgi:activator of HSP90 ATPase
MLIAGAAALGGLTLTSASRADDAKPPSPDAARTTLHQDVEFKATAGRIYSVLLDAQQFAAFTGKPADIDPRVGGAFHLFGGLIEGRIVELVPDRRIVQAWRSPKWDGGIFSNVRFLMQPHGTTTAVVLDHTGFPEGEYDSLSSGWREYYWDPLAKYLG